MLTNGRIKPRLLFYDCKSRFDQVDGISADHDVERAWLDDAVHVAIQEREFVEAERKLDGFCFAGIERNSAEAAQFFDGARDGTDFVADVELHDFVAADFAGVGDVHADVGRALWADGIRRQVEIVIFESGIAESPAEGKEW